MKNEEKYITPEERLTAFEAHCDSTKCWDCPFVLEENSLKCFAHWLSAEVIEPQITRITQIEPIVADWEAQ